MPTKPQSHKAKTPKCRNLERVKHHRVFIGLGSNLAPREKNITAALAALETTREIEVVRVSSMYETDAVGGPAEQGKYLNAVVEVATTLSADRLLSVCQRIENSLGRKRELRWGPRTIDLDILLFDDEIHSTAELTIPHPLMHERRFVLEPLVEIASEVVHPTLEQSARDLLADLGPS